MVELIKALIYGVPVFIVLFAARTHHDIRKVQRDRTTENRH